MRAPCAFILCAALAVGARADVEFVGISSDRAGSLFLITDAGGARLSGWLALGGSFAGSRISSYEAKTGILAVERGSASLRLTLRDGRTLGDLAGSQLAHDKRVADWVQMLDCYRTIVRVIAQGAGLGSTKYTVTEVWRTDGTGPTVGDVIDGMNIKASEKSVTYERLVCYGDGKARADLSLFGGRFIGAGEPVGADEVRDVISRLEHSALRPTN